ncbi:MAG: DegT/DnrJ/EryC1/StrS family aminotransferase [Candidatus Rokubacteria bacterium]|nr:DegT/DnrJ/EryC1/StrS family aminotransferase [Candidatus Rokubacteria bacterium]
MTTLPPIPHSRPTLGEQDCAAVAAAVASGQLAQGPRVAEFEQAMAARLGVPGGVAVSSGTAALHLALLALGVGAGDEVIVPSYACAALLHAVRATGALPCPADVDPATFDLDPDAAKRACSARTRALIAVHAFGLPADLGALAGVGVPVVEDAAQALGARYGGRPVGGLGRVGVLSFYATKLMTTGEGGMLVSGDAALLAAARDLREYDQKPDDRPRFNYKLTEPAAALGLAQLARLDGFLARRQAIAARYRQGLAGAVLEPPRVPPGRTHVYHRYVVKGRAPAEPRLRALEARGVQARRPVFRPLHRYLGLAPEAFPGTEEAWARAVSLPIYPSLRPEEVDRVLAAAAETAG